MEDLSLGIALGVLAMLGFGLSNAFVKRPAEKLGSVQTIFLRQIFLIGFIILSLFFFPIHSIRLEDLAIAIGIGIVGYFPFLFFMKAIAKGKIGVISPIAGSSVIFTVILSIFFYGETLTLEQVISIALVVFGVIIISLRPDDWKKRISWIGTQECHLLYWQALVGG